MKKISVWDILTGVVLLSIVCFSCGALQVFLNPHTPLNPLPPRAEVTLTSVTLPEVNLQLPTLTVSPQGGKGLSLTPTPAQGLATRTLRPSSTLPPTNTPFIPHTRTPQPTNTPTITLTVAGANCYILSEAPADNTPFAPGQSFDKFWVVKNNSGQTWESANLDVRYRSGDKLQTGGDVYDLPGDVPNQGSIQITIPMKAPASKGTYTSSWAIMGDKSYCSFFAKIVVK